MIGNENCDSDWGRAILEDFVARGGFANGESLATAHTRLSDLITSDYDPDDDWHLRCNTLAVFVLIQLELGIPIEPDDLISISIASALERLPNRECPYWFGQLTFDLALWACSTDTIHLGNVSDSLFQTIKQTTKAIWDDEFVTKGARNIAPLDYLLWEGANANVRQLIHTKNLLEKLGSAGAAEAFFFLSLGFGAPSQCDKWLCQAADAKGSVGQVASFDLGCKLKSREINRWQNRVKSVKFPSEDDSEFEFLCNVATKARALDPYYYGGKNLYGGHSGFFRYRDHFSDWSTASPEVSDQWETVKRCFVAVYDILGVEDHRGSQSVDKPEHIRSLAVETGRLVEAYLKWCLSRWFPDYRRLDETTPIRDQQLSQFSQFVGPILGRADCGSGITLHELFSASGLSIERGHDVEFLIGKDGKGIHKRSHTVWNCKNASIPSLVVANALATKCDENHPYRNIESDLLINAMSTFNAAYNLRNSNAHYARKNGSRDNNDDTLFLSSSVLMIVDQLMMASVPSIGVEGN